MISQLLQSLILSGNKSQVSRDKYYQACYLSTGLVVFGTADELNIGRPSGGLGTHTPSKTRPSLSVTRLHSKPLSRSISPAFWYRSIFVYSNLARFRLCWILMLVPSMYRYGCVIAGHAGCLKTILRYWNCCIAGQKTVFVDLEDESWLGSRFSSF